MILNKEHRRAIEKARRDGTWTVRLDENIYWINPDLSGNVDEWILDEQEDETIIWTEKKRQEPEAEAPSEVNTSVDTSGKPWWDFFPGES